MKAFNRILVIVVAAIIAVFATANVILISDDNENGRPYLVEISRLVQNIEKDGYDSSVLSGCEYVTAVS